MVEIAPGVRGQWAVHTHEGIMRKGGVTGGARKMRYWTPDGREILAVPSMRTYRMTQSGIEGIRDANLDKGWLMQPPTDPKPYCPHCTNWHDTLEEVKECGAKKKAMQARYDKAAKKTIRSEGGEVAELKEKVSGLETDISDIKSMLTKILKGKE